MSKFFAKQTDYILQLNTVADEVFTPTIGKAVRQNAIRGGDASTNPWQRGTSFAGLTTGSTYTADGWIYASASVASVVTVSRQANAPTVAQAGKLLTDCFDISVTTADISIAAGDIATFQQRVEGYIWRRYAQRATGIRFQHAHSKVGTHCVSLRSSTSDRSLVVEYTQLVANAWEEAVVDLPASPSAGTWNYTNGIGVMIDWVLAAGSTFQTAAVGWASANAVATANQVNNLDQVGNHFRIADVRFVLGSAANGGEIRASDAGEEWLIAQRYLPSFEASLGQSDRYQSYCISTTQSAVSLVHKVPLRTTSTGIVVSAASDWNIFSPKTGATGACTAIVANVGGGNSTNIVCTVVAGSPTIAAGDLVVLFPANANARILVTGAEL